MRRIKEGDRYILYCECGEYLGQSEDLPSVGKTVVVKEPCEHKNENSSDIRHAREA